MARLDYPDLNRLPEARALVDRIVAERGSILHLYRMLMHSTPVAEGWLAYLTRIRQQTRLDGFVRELVIVRIAYLNRSSYEADQHLPFALREGLTPEQLEALKDEHPDPALFDERARSVLAYADAMTRSVQVPDGVYAAVQSHFDARGVVELTATIAAYNMVSRFLEALQIHSSDNIGTAPSTR